MIHAMIHVAGHYAYEDFSLSMDFEIQRAELVAVIGPSGAGKSTLLAILAGFEKLSQGSVRIDGEDVSAKPSAQRPLSMVFQDHNVFAHLSAFDNVALGLSPSLSLNAQQTQAVQTSLERVGIGPLAQRLPGDMSGGERQRIALARVLVRDRPILLLDEPFAALGPALRRDMLKLVRELQKERNLTVLMVTHDPDDAMRIADRVMFVGDHLARPPIETAHFFATQDAAVRAYLG
jgi:thiamine transport system ATP-binding protein